MANGSEVLLMLCPNDQWTISGNDYESIVWSDGIPKITKKQFEAGFKQYENWASEQEKNKKSERDALLEKLGITEEEAALLAQSL